MVSEYCMLANDVGAHVALSYAQLPEFSRLRIFQQDKPAELCLKLGMRINLCWDPFTPPDESLYTIIGEETDRHPDPRHLFRKLRCARSATSNHSHHPCHGRSVNGSLYGPSWGSLHNTKSIGPRGILISLFDEALWESS